MMSISSLSWLIATCTFAKASNPTIVAFELVVLAVTIACFLLLPKLKNKIGWRFLAIAVGVLLFELFTGPMWHNYRLGIWAYVYRDVSWILTLGWTSLILAVVTAIDKLLPHWKEWKRFLLYLFVLTLFAFPLEILVVNIGIRGYAPEVLAALSGVQAFSVPIEALYYIPVFMGLVISFYKYWSFEIDKQPLIPLKKRKWFRSFLLALLAVFLFEVMVEPMARNEKFPAWSYLFHDISFFTIGAWILMIGAAAAIVGKFFSHYSTPARLLVAVSIASALMLPLEVWMLRQGNRIYVQSVLHEYTGHKIPLLDIPVEVAIAIPFYATLIIVFIRYWETAIDNKL